MKNHEWLARNSLRSFPVREGSNIIAINSGWTLIPSLLVDVDVFADMPGDFVLCLQSVTITRSICSITIGNASSGQSLGYASFVVGVHKPYSQIKMEPLADGVSGFVSFGPAMLAEEYSKMPTGIHTFETSALLESRCGISIGSFPIKTIGARGLDGMSGEVSITLDDAVSVSVSEGEDDGDPISLVSLSLKKPSDFLSPCEEKTTQCDCDSIPIETINGVSGDVEGKITIEIEDESGNLYLIGSHTLLFEIIRTGRSLCSKADVPDSYGRLLGPSGSYDDDLPPTNEYKNPADTTFPLPVI